MVVAIALNDQLRKQMAKKKRSLKKVPGAIEREAKRAEQKAQGALDGRFRVKRVESGKRYSRKRKNVDPDSGEK